MCNTLPPPPPMSSSTLDSRANQKYALIKSKREVKICLFAKSLISLQFIQPFKI